MNVLRLRTGALAGLAAALLGCASAKPIQDATVLSGPPGKGAAKDKTAAASGAIAMPSDIENAVRQAQAMRQNGDFPGAAKTLSQLVLVAPDDPRVLAEYAKTLIAEGRSDDALAFLERGIALQPADWSLYSAQGVAYDQKGDYRAAQASYGQALALKPGDPTVLSNDALSHMQAGDLAGAETLLLEAAQSGSAFPRIASNLALVRSLRASAAQAAAAQHSAEPPAQGIAPPALPVQPATPPPAAIPAPVPESAAIAATPPVPRPVAVESAPLPAPESPQHAAEPRPLPPSAIQPVPEEAPPPALKASAAQADAGPPSIKKLRADPSVRMQAVPKDPIAGPVAPKLRRTLTDTGQGRIANGE